MSKRDFFIEEARKVHGDKYDYSKVEYKRAHDKMCIICPKHGEFWQDKYTHLGGSGCPKCARETVGDKHRFTQENFIKRCKEVWGDRYSYEHIVYTTIMKKIIITCPIHGKFEVIANDFIRGHGCPKCGGTKKLTTEEFIERAREIHGDKYDYSKVEYINNRTKVCVICPIHGEFWQTPANHLNGDKCPGCYRSLKKTTEQFIEEAKKIHGNKYDYSKTTYNGNKKPITIVCPEHGEWITRPLEHLHGKGCKLCKQSHLEKTVENILIENNIVFEAQKRFTWLGFQTLDFYLPDQNIAIECQGEQHFTPIELFGGEGGFKTRLTLDIKKRQHCTDNNLKVIYITGDKSVLDINNVIYQGIYTNDNIIKISDFNNKIKNIL